MKANKFVISGSIDPRKIADIEKFIRSHEGINAARVDLQATTVTVDYDEGRYSEQDISCFVKEAGIHVAQVK